MFKSTVELDCFTKVSPAHPLVSVVFLSNFGYAIVLYTVTRHVYTGVNTVY